MVPDPSVDKSFIWHRLTWRDVIS